jgi:hypothetical protein
MAALRTLRAYACANTNTNTNGDCYGDSHRYGNGNTNSYRDGNRNADSHGNSDAHSNARSDYADCHGLQKQRHRHSKSLLGRGDIE